jgi:hypothetical protein
VRICKADVSYRYQFDQKPYDHAPGNACEGSPSMVGRQGKFASSRNAALLTLIQ